MTPEEQQEASNELLRLSLAELDPKDAGAIMRALVLQIGEKVKSGELDCENVSQKQLRVLAADQRMRIGMSSAQAKGLQEDAQAEADAVDMDLLAGARANLGDV